MANNIGDLGKIIVLGVLTSLMLGTVGLMISSFTNRKGVAIAIILIGFLVVTGIANALAFSLEQYEWGKWFLLGDLSAVTLVLSNHFFNDLQGNDSVEMLDLTQTQAIAVMLGLSLVAGLIFRWRYAATDNA
jgi:hypothetical protein